MSISILQHTQGIQAYQLHRSEYKEGFYIAHISKKPNKQQCIACKSFNVTPTFINERIVKALPMGIKAIRRVLSFCRLLFAVLFPILLFRLPQKSYPFGGFL